MTFIEKTKLFFAPLRENKLLTLFSCIKFFTWWFNAVVWVLIIRGAVKAIEHNDPILLNHWIKLFILLFFAYLTIGWVFRKTDWPHLYHRVEMWIYNRYLPMLVTLDSNYLESIWTWRIISVIKEGTKTWIDQLSFFIKEITKITVTGGFLIYLLSGIGLSYAFSLVIGLIIIHILIIWIDSYTQKYRRIRTEEKWELSRNLVRIIMSRNEIMQNNSILNEMKNVQWSVSRMANANDKINRSLFAIFNLVRVLTLVLRVWILAIMWHGVFSQTYSLTDFVAVMTMVLVFESFLFDSTEFYKNFTKEFVDIEKLWATFENAPQMKGYSTWKSFSPKNQNIQINNLSYGYNDTKVFSDFSLTIEKGKKTALVWASGGGKTTLMKLIAGYLHPESWNISVMGNVLAETALKSYYPHIGYLTQDPWVFDATIRENLVSAIAEKKTNTQTVTQRNVSVIAKNEAIQVPEKKSMDRFVPRDDETQELEQKLHEALRLAQCDFVFDLEKWLDTEIGERGVRLSGGQKQRLAIAKIFLKNPEIILLDEPTSALDSFSEERITEALDTLFEGRTVIIIAHRLQTVKRADDIIVIEWWQVVERGTHTSLTREKWVYHKMLELQSGF